MKDKVLVEIVVPSVELSYDIFIPVSRKVGNVIALVTKTVFELSNGIFTPDEHTLFYDYNSGLPYELDVLIKDTNIRNGSKVILF